MYELDRRPMQPFLRIAVRRGRRHARRAGNWEAVRACTAALETPDILDAVLEQLIATRDGEIITTAIGDGTFLEWLIENWDTILKMLMDIIDLFSRPSS